MFQLILPFQLELPFEQTRLPERRRTQRRRRCAEQVAVADLSEERRQGERRIGFDEG